MINMASTAHGLCSVRHMKNIDVRIDPQWLITSPEGLAVPPRVLAWLADVQTHGSLSAACKVHGASYRHTWKLLREAEAALGAPLLSMVRGQGSVLTPMGEALVWSRRRLEARLRPQLDSLAFELAAELHRLSAGVDRPLRVHASHGFAIELLQRLMSEGGDALDWRYTDSSAALSALSRGDADVASIHLPIDPAISQPHALQAQVLQHCARWLDPDWQYVHMVVRRQGLMVRPGNPLHIDGVADLLRPDVRFVPRAPGSGTRLLLEALLRQQGLDASTLGSATGGEHTHSAVAAYVASGMADAGFGVETSARQFGLEFIPVQTERYGLLASPTVIDAPAMQRVLALLRGEAFQGAIQALPGYRLDDCGAVAPAAQVMASWPRAAPN
jgi:molybdate transport repressor ModE-like protein